MYKLITPIYVKKKIIIISPGCILKTKSVDMSWHRRIVCWIYQFEIYGNNLEFGFIFIRNTGLHTHPAKLGKDVDVSFATLQWKGKKFLYDIIVQSKRIDIVTHMHLLSIMESHQACVAFHNLEDMSFSHLSLLFYFFVFTPPFHWQRI